MGDSVGNGFGSEDGVPAAKFDVTGDSGVLADFMFQSAFDISAPSCQRMNAVLSEAETKQETLCELGLWGEFGKDIPG